MSLPEPEAAKPCPVCHKSAVYVRRLDRFVHEDGSDNRECWLAMISGSAPYDSSSRLKEWL